MTNTPISLQDLRRNIYVKAKAEPFADIEAQGVEKFLEQIQGELIDRTYVPLRSRRREIPKDGGKVRILSIPAIRDRVVQGALKLIMEPVSKRTFNRGRMVIVLNAPHMRRCIE